MKFISSLLLACALLAPIGLSAQESWREDPTVTGGGFTWGGGGVPDGVSDATSINTAANTDIRATIVDALNDILSLLGIIAVFVLIIGGLILITGQGTDESRDKVRRLVVNTIGGLIIILFAKAIVEFYIQTVTT